MPEKLIAFCHIEKAAGTSLIHVLRRVFFLRYAAVRPMHSRETLNFSSKDLDVILKINPFIHAIGGHSVAPYGDLMRRAKSLTFITQVRDPVSRAVSQYRFWNNRQIDDSGPESFLKHPVSQNFQVKKLAGQNNFQLAKNNILENFMLAGTVERFEEFLVLLAQKLGLPLNWFTYRKQNVDCGPSDTNIPNDFADRLRERNQLDQSLYDWIDGELYPRYISEYHGDFAADLAEFNILQAEGSESQLKIKIDAVYRNAYLKPVSGLIRVWNGLPYHGSYAYE